VQAQLGLLQQYCVPSSQVVSLATAKVMLQAGERAAARRHKPLLNHQSRSGYGCQHPPVGSEPPLPWHDGLQQLPLASLIWISSSRGLCCSAQEPQWVRARCPFVEQAEDAQLDLLHSLEDFWRAHGSRMLAPHSVTSAPCCVVVKRGAGSSNTSCSQICCINCSSATR
jgi:hypothetical protein